MVVVGWPVTLKVIQKRRPVMGQAILHKILDGKRKAMVNADNYRPIFGKLLDQPMGDLFSGPVPAGTWRRRLLNGRQGMIRHEDPQPFEARIGCLGA